MTAMGLAATVCASNEPTLIRGPYLQNGNTTNMTVRWRTSLPSDTLVRYGTNHLELDLMQHRDESVTNHTVVLTNLVPGRWYYYAVGQTGTLLASGADYRFRTSPATNESIRLWAIGDSGTVSAGDLGALAVRDAYYEHADEEPTDVWLMLGDNAYQHGTDAQYQVAVFETYHELLRNTVVWSTVGNHELLRQDGSGHFAYLDIFSPPEQGEAGGIPSGTPLYYSFDYANAHFICLDSEFYRGTNETMMAWLEEDLAATTQDWMIAFWHTPPYSKGSHDSDNALDSRGGLFIMRTNVLPVLESHGVDLVLCGHSHNYERSFLLNGHYGTSDQLQSSMIVDHGSGRIDEWGPYYKPKTTAAGQGTIYIVNGSSGWTRASPVRRHPAMFTQIVELGSVVIDINGDRLDARFLRETGAIDDYFTILKSDDEMPFRIQYFDKRDGLAEVLAWRSEPGGRYQVETSEDLAGLGWAVTGEPITATARTTYWTNQVTEMPPKNYYRIRELGETEP